MTEPSAVATVQIEAHSEVVYGLITDLATLAALAEETVAMQWRTGSSVAPGAIFIGRNENSGQRWTTKCTVTDAEPGRVFGFDMRHTVFPVARRQYDIVAADGGCRITDRVAATTGHIRLTLQRLNQRAESG